MKPIELRDGSRIVRFQSVDTPDGSDLRVWLTDAPVIEGTAGWYVFDNEADLDLGALKVSRDRSKLEIPAGMKSGDYGVSGAHASLSPA